VLVRTAALAILALLAAGCGAREDPRGARIDALLRAYTGSVPGRSSAAPTGSPTSSGEHP